MMEEAVANAQRMRQEEEERQAAARAEEDLGAEAGATAAGGQQDTPRELDENTLREHLRNLCRRGTAMVFPEWNDIQEGVRRANVNHLTYDEEILSKIGPVFVMSAIPLNFLPLVHLYDRNVLVQHDIEAVSTKTTNEGKREGAAELLSRLSRYRGWFQCTLNVLRDPRVRQRHLAEKMEELVREPVNARRLGNDDNMVEVQHDGAVRSDAASNRGAGAFEMTEERKEKLKLAYKSQGGYEMEFTYGFTEDQKKRKAECARCSRSDRADKFIPIKEFDLQHLPKEHQSLKVLESFRSFADICVQIVVQHTSNHRPLGYPLYELGGDHELYRLGNGWITHLEDKFKSENTDTCPCKDCRSHADTAKGLWGEIYVGTAKHLVFNNKECEFTQCLCFYDTDDPSSPPPPRLQGVEVSNRQILMRDSGAYEIKCITHDYELFSRLMSALKSTDNFVTYECKHTGQDCFYRVAISHVHGLGKQVSIIADREVELFKDVTGKWIKKRNRGKHVYNAATCLGSSGAPVCLIGTHEAEPALQHLIKSMIGYKSYAYFLLDSIAHGKCVKDNVYESP